MNQHRNRYRAAAVVAGLALLAAACGTDDDTATQPPPSAATDGASAGAVEATPVTVSEVIRSVFYAPMYVAAGAGIFEDHGLEVTIETANGSDKVTAALLSRNADIGLLGPETAIFVHNQDSAQEVAIFHQLTQRDGSFLLASEADDDGFQLADLAGTTVIGWRVGSMPQMVMNYLLASEGVDGVDYVTNVQAPAMAGAFTSGQGEYVQLFEPVVSTLVEGGQGHVVASVGELADPFPYTVFAALESRAESDPDLLARFSAAMEEAVAFVMERPSSESAEALASYFPDSDVELLAQAVERYRDIGAWATDPTLDPAQFERLQDIMVAGEVLEEDGRVAYEELVVRVGVGAAG